MIFYDQSLNQWVRKPGLSTPPWESLAIPIGARYNLAVQFCEGAEITPPSYSDMSATIKAAGSPSTTALVTAAAAYDSGNGSIIFELDLSETPAQDEDFTACYLQISYTVDTFEYLTPLLEVSLINNYTA
jgi:hypothetical protein